MAERYRFFFSYARRDRDAYLTRFFMDLRDRVSQKLAEPDPSFRDLDQIEPGDDWPEALVDALQRSDTLVCIYSPWYFKREYCGKEISVFLKREGVTVDEGGRPHGARRIIPVLWLKENDLKQLGMPPETLKGIGYAIGAEQHHDVYTTKGLIGILRTSGGKGHAYNEILESLAELIRDRSRPELPPLEPRPRLSEVASAYELIAAPPAERNAPPPAAGAASPGTPVLAERLATDSPPPGGPGVLRAVYVARGDLGLNAGAAVGETGAPALRSLIGDVALECRMHLAELRIDPTDPDASQHLDEALRDATARNEVVVVVGAPTGADTVHRLLQHVASGVDWRGGVVILGNAAAVTTEPALSTDSAPSTPAGDSVLLTQLRGQSAESRVVLHQHIAELQRRVVAAGTVQRLIVTEGPKQRPQVVGPRELAQR